ncbi:hypothetical protein [Anaerosacchariphilus polymeriproducens]|uniref:Uncharacterized protein n=1 Tax=Anaerosacchariphilus polymeriproducens TaxID=1812858 RepID=A0A371AY48_9FIRM|nr:hypothetical protein [Anaerosacchariphilus polymeriproducens]RDU24508.1 hypothetical protein DWV06_03325 [Anaerosacchariphilus polymeriproducens]
MIKRKKIAALLTCMAILGSTNIAHAETKEFSFTVSNRIEKSGYYAKKADNEQFAYITATSFKGGRTNIAVGVKQEKDSSVETVAWTFTKQNYKNKQKIEYTRYAAPRLRYKVFCEGFGSGTGTIEGRYTP